MPAWAFLVPVIGYYLYMGLLYGLLRFLSRHEGYIPYPFGWREWLTILKGWNC